jgi:hypothetical protein
MEVTDFDAVICSDVQAVAVPIEADADIYCEESASSWPVDNAPKSLDYG